MGDTIQKLQNVDLWTILVYRKENQLPRYQAFASALSCVQISSLAVTAMEQPLRKPRVVVPLAVGVPGNFKIFQTMGVLSGTTRLEIGDLVPVQIVIKFSLVSKKQRNRNQIRLHKKVKQFF